MTAMESGTMDLLDQAETLTRGGGRGADSDDDIFGFGQRAVSGEGTRTLAGADRQQSRPCTCQVLGNTLWQGAAVGFRGCIQRPASPRVCKPRVVLSTTASCTGLMLRNSRLHLTCFSAYPSRGDLA